MFALVEAERNLKNATEHNLVTLVIMRTVEFTAPPGSEEELFHEDIEGIGNLGDLSRLSDINIFTGEVADLNQDELKELESELASNLGKFEYELKKEPGELWHQVLANLLNEIETKILIVTNHIEGNTLEVEIQPS